MFNEQLIFYRKQAGLSQRKIAQLLNITQQAYSLYETGLREPTFDTLKKLCKIFNCTSDELLELDIPN